MGIPLPWYGPEAYCAVWKLIKKSVGLGLIV